ncbi:MAG: hypothetical protein M3360_02595, partial [Actinomycetota bacterium]|nr:hypothetical protein [Actinomycetota bacterium]
MEVVRMRRFRSTAIVFTAVIALAGTLVIGLTGAQAAGKKKCLGKRATIFGTRGNNEIEGTRGADVIVGRGGNDRI